MKRFGVLFFLLVLVTLSGCQYYEEFQDKRYARHNKYGDAWLSDQQFPPEINITGHWKSEDWGHSFFSQNGSQVDGHLGDYPVKGVVSGRQAFLLVSQGGWYYYSVILDMPGPDMLIGYYSRSVPYKAAWRDNIRLDRKF